MGGLYWANPGYKQKTQMPHVSGLQQSHKPKSRFLGSDGTFCAPWAVKILDVVRFSQSRLGLKLFLAISSEYHGILVHEGCMF